jgi:hypothetical protein
LQPRSWWDAWSSVFSLMKFLMQEKWWSCKGGRCSEKSDNHHSIGRFSQIWLYQLDTKYKSWNHLST